MNEVRFFIYTPYPSPLGLTDTSPQNFTQQNVALPLTQNKTKNTSTDIFIGHPHAKTVASAVGEVVYLNRVARLKISGKPRITN